MCSTIERKVLPELVPQIKVREILYFACNFQTAEEAVQGWAFTE